MVFREMHPTGRLGEGISVEIAILVCLIVICLLMASIAVVIGCCVLELQSIAAFLSTGRATDMLRMPWEGDESTLNVVKPRGEFPDQM